ncbi:unnamed protein product [Gemmata massiliana]|uniref:Uncharacterized protein n=1 Tax=Gemmata massiliana TaxID=1210884 RepID=A0A6P2DCN5_9BACT|nr:hypothetical protein [Gemmata massiliana]VTR98533.1 unnamed protein product [Gemmata massiliana]
MSGAIPFTTAPRTRAATSFCWVASHTTKISYTRSTGNAPGHVPPRSHNRARLSPSVPVPGTGVFSFSANALTPTRRRPARVRVSTVPCPHVGIVPVDPAAQRRWAVRLPALAGTVGTALGATGGTTERAPGRVWKLGTIRAGGACGSGSSRPG